MQLSSLFKASLLVLPLFFISACESQQEKREKLEAQYEHWRGVADRCGFKKARNAELPPECKDADKKADEIQVQLKKLNGIE